MKQTAKLEVGDILPLALTLVVAGIGISFGLNILEDMKNDGSMCATGYQYNSTADGCTSLTNGGVRQDLGQFNATKDTITGVAKFADKMGLIATVIVAAIVIGLLVRFMMTRN